MPKLVPNTVFCVTCCKQRWHLGITSPSSVCLSVRPSVCLSVRTSHFSYHPFYFANYLIPTDAIEMKLHMWIELKRFKSHAQVQKLVFCLLELSPFKTEKGDFLHVSTVNCWFFYGIWNRMIQCSFLPQVLPENQMQILIITEIMYFP